MCIQQHIAYCTLYVISAATVTFPLGFIKYLSIYQYQKQWNKTQEGLGDLVEAHSLFLLLWCWAMLRKPQIWQSWRAGLVFEVEQADSLYTSLKPIFKTNTPRWKTGKQNPLNLWQWFIWQYSASLSSGLLFTVATGGLLIINNCCQWSRQNAPIYSRTPSVLIRFNKTARVGLQMSDADLQCLDEQLLEKYCKCVWKTCCFLSLDRMTKLNSARHVLIFRGRIFTVTPNDIRAYSHTQIRICPTKRWLIRAGQHITHYTFWHSALDAWGQFKFNEYYIPPLHTTCSLKIYFSKSHSDCMKVVQSSVCSDFQLMQSNTELVLWICRSDQFKVFNLISKALTFFCGFVL